MTKVGDYNRPLCNICYNCNMKILDAAYLRKNLPLIQEGLLRDDIVANGQLLHIPEGQTILREDQFIDHIPLVAKGGIKVIRHAEAEQRLFLYFIRPGETCTMTLTACLQRQQSQVYARTVMPTDLVLLPAQRVFYYTKHFPGWNDFTLRSFRQKFDDILSAYDRLAFAPLEQRITDYLAALAALRGQPDLPITHAELATDLGASRVSVSRILKTLAHQGVLSLGHGRLVVPQD